MRQTIQLNLLGKPVGNLEKESKFCRICGRPLKNPDSIAKGMGPVCEKKLRRWS